MDMWFSTYGTPTGVTQINSWIPGNIILFCQIDQCFSVIHTYSCLFIFFGPLNDNILIFCKPFADTTNILCRFYGISNIVNLSGCFSNIRYRVYRIYGSIGILSKINNIVSFGHSFNNRAAPSSKGNSKRYNVCCKSNPSPRIIRVFDDVNNAEAKRHNIEYCIPKLTAVVYTHTLLCYLVC